MLTIDFLRFKKRWDTVRVSPVELDISYAMSACITLLRQKRPSLV